MSISLQKGQVSLKYNQERKLVDSDSKEVLDSD